MARRRRSRGSSSSGINPMNAVIGGGIYGAGRQTVVNILGNMFPNMGPQAQSLALGVGGYLLAKNTKGIFRNVGIGAMYVESATQAHGLIGSQTANTSSQGYTTGAYTYN